jgi:hypothetical protein
MTTDDFKRGSDCLVEGSGGWCVTAEGCVGACRYPRNSAAVVELADQLAGQPSTMARLRRVERENEGLRGEIGRLRTEADRFGARAVRLGEELEAARAVLGHVKTERDEEAALAVRLRAFWNECCRDRHLITAELASARQQLASASWIVARDGGRYCERCEGEVRRGEAYELEPGSGGLMVHIHCPNEKKE